MTISAVQAGPPWRPSFAKFNAAKHICMRLAGLASEAYGSCLSCEKQRQASACLTQLAWAHTLAYCKLMYHFLQFSLTCLNRLNAVFQAKGCRVLKLAEETRILLRACMANFVKPDVIAAAADVTVVDF